MKMRCRMAGAWPVLLAASTIANAQDAPAKLDESAALSFSQAAIGRTLGRHRLTDRRGRTLELDEFRGRPLVVSLIYTSCAHTCPMLTTHLKDVVETAREALGEESFAVLTVGFDAANDTPARMASFARERGIDLSDWYFASADAATIDALSHELGFVFQRSAAGFDHLTQTTVVDAGGRVYAQLYG
ncbi:MAG TPA: SCO family protein, partial [Woeseiaceae bacterium]|nr:SCO family protein [Woeseiaceae bacterium]